MASGVDLYPICALVHSINSPTMLTAYISTLLLAEPYDSIVVTSEAGYITIKHLLENARTLLEARIGGRGLEVPVVKIPLGVDAEVLTPRDQRMSRELLHIPLDSFVMLYVGRLTESEKADLEPLIDVLQSFIENGTPAHLLLAGQDKSGEYCERLNAMAELRNVRRHFTIIPNFPYFVKPWLFSAADVFISPSDNIQETFGIAIVEAMACGLPVVASDWSGYRDLVAEGETGFLVPTYWYGDMASSVSQIAPVCDVTMTRHSLARRTVIDLRRLRQTIGILLENRELRMRFGENGRSKVLKDFCWPVIMKKLVDLWVHQWDCLRRQQQQRYSKILFKQDYHRLFSHFATHSVNMQLVLRRSQKIVNNTTEFPSHFSRDHIDRILEECALEGITVEQLKCLMGDKGADVAIWLWKKGYLEPVTDPEC